MNLELAQKISRILEDDKSPSIGSDTWMKWFIGREGNQYFCEVDYDFITDRFNLMNLMDAVPKYTQVIQYIVDKLSPTILERMTIPRLKNLEVTSRKMYGLVHARYIITIKGLKKMNQKYKDADFGRCPREYCDNHPLLPVGLHDTPGIDTVKLYCPSCEDLYNPRESKISSVDGAFFGTTFPGIMLQTFPEIVPTHPIKRYTPTISGFELHDEGQLARWQELQRLKLIKSRENTSFIPGSAGDYK